MSYLGMSSQHDRPLPSIVLHDIWMEDDNVRHTVLQDIAEHFVTEHVDLATIFKEPSLPTSGGNEGTAYEYACEVLTLGLLIFNFKVAVREVTVIIDLQVYAIAFQGYWKKELCN